jgi:hypothetical protein
MRGNSALFKLGSLERLHSLHPRDSDGSENDCFNNSSLPQENDCRAVALQRQRDTQTHSQTLPWYDADRTENDAPNSTYLDLQFVFFPRSFLDEIFIAFRTHYYSYYCYTTDGIEVVTWIYFIKLVTQIHWACAKHSSTFHDCYVVQSPYGICASAEGIYDGSDCYTLWRK